MRISDWSSDVCSSDLGLVGPDRNAQAVRHFDIDQAGDRDIAAGPWRRFSVAWLYGDIAVCRHVGEEDAQARADLDAFDLGIPLRVADDSAFADIQRENGRASCRERVWQYV